MLISGAVGSLVEVFQLEALVIEPSVVLRMGVQTPATENASVLPLSGDFLSADAENGCSHEEGHTSDRKHDLADSYENWMVQCQ